MDISCSSIWEQDGSWEESMAELKVNVRGIHDRHQPKRGFCWRWEFSWGMRNNEIQNLWPDEYEFTEKSLVAI